MRFTMQQKILTVLFAFFALPALADDYGNVDGMASESDLSGFSLPPMQMPSAQPLPDQSTGDYPAGMQPAAPLAPNPHSGFVDNALAPLNVYLSLDFTDTMSNEITLEYQYFYTDVRRVPWKGQMILENHSDNQSVQIPRTSGISRILLFLRPAGAGSSECVPMGGQTPIISNDMTAVQLIGVTDANGNYQCQLVYR